MWKDAKRKLRNLNIRLDLKNYSNIKEKPNILVKKKEMEEALSSVFFLKNF